MNMNDATMTHFNVNSKIGIGIDGSVIPGSRHLAFGILPYGTWFLNIPTFFQQTFKLESVF